MSAQLRKQESEVRERGGGLSLHEKGGMFKILLFWINELQKVVILRIITKILIVQV